MKGIILAGGKGTRLYPLTHSLNKHLLPVYNKPLIYYPLSVLMLAGIRDILLISSPGALSQFEDLLGDGSKWGIRIDYARQEKPRGLADAFNVGRDFVGGASVCLILGDNIFYGTGLPKVLRESVSLQEGAILLAYPVQDPQRFGVVEFDEDMNVISLEEKPRRPKSNYAATGIYFYDNRVVEYVSDLAPSPRGELEITDLNKMYLKRKALSVKLMGRGMAWLDAGTHETLLEASNYVRALERRQGLMISSPDEIAYRMGFINHKALLHLAGKMANNGYAKYLKEIE